MIIIKGMNNYEIELLSYDDSYKKSFFKTSLNYLESLTKRETNYCFTKHDNKELLKLCSELKMHTIKPTLIINSHLYREVKKNVSPGSIIYIDNNNYNIKELSVTIDYLQSKGYNFVILRELLDEKNKKYIKN